MKTDDYYQLLGVSRFATQEALKHAYRCRLLSVHPDRNPEDEVASERTLKIIEAYHALSDPWARQRYDATLAPPPEPAPTPFPLRGASTLPAWAFRALTYAAMLAVMAYVVFALVQSILGDQGRVFRPDVSLLQSEARPRSFPLVAQPDFSDCTVWYTASEYQLGFGGAWARRTMLDAYAQAASQAERRGDIRRAHFFRSCMAESDGSRSALDL